MEISKKKEADQRIEDLNRKLVSTARNVGMAEVAATMLHNLGNVLNSANVSLAVLKETAVQLNIQKILKAIELLKEHDSNLNLYLTQDEKGKLIPKYLIASANNLKKGYEEINQEIDNLKTFLDHIKEIVAVQQDLAGTAGLVEKIILSEIIETAIQMCLSQKSPIHIVKLFETSIAIYADKSKLLQILVNLIRNAMDSLLECQNAQEKEIILTIKKSGANVKIYVKDNGLGIDPSDFTKIFRFGFTSKKLGHGFGLHSSSLFAKEMGGTLEVFSKGIGEGATFVLSIPIQAIEE
ncbi:MAG: ATP-binding protein [Proteobacteria bacterium]|nr:ATP-binding protein [Pseudomonadota bacterium]